MGHEIWFLRHKIRKVEYEEEGFILPSRALEIDGGSSVLQSGLKISENLVFGKCYQDVIRHIYM